MQFYCPNCQQLVEAPSETTVTTKFNQTYHKSHCPVCTHDVSAKQPVADVAAAVSLTQTA